MPRDISGVASPPPGTTALPSTTIASQPYNSMVADVYNMMNSPWPIALGGTGHAEGAPTLEQIQALIASAVSAAVPIGTQHVNTGRVLPPGYIWAHGGSFSRSQYPELWTWIQASGNLASTQAAKTAGQYGPGNGTSTFTVPDLREYFVRSSTVGNTGRVQSDELRSHGHSATTSPSGAHTHDYQVVRDFGTSTRAVMGSGSVQGSSPTLTAGVHTHPVNINNTGGAETRPMNISYPFMIKAT